jgi:hypothetical protein
VRGAAACVLAGQLGFIVVTQFHPGGDANDHPAIFATYAHSEAWGVVHALQFVATAVMVAGLVALCAALVPKSGLDLWLARTGAALAIASLAMYGVLQAADGIGNKQVDKAWVAAEGPQRAVRYATAEAMRWLEWGLSSYYSYTAGLALLVVGLAVAVCRPVSAARAIAVLVALSGVAMLARGGVSSAEGFTGVHSALIVTTWVLNLAWAAWLVLAGRTPASPKV